MTDKKKDHDNNLRLRKTLLYIILIVSFIPVYIFNVWLYSTTTRNSLYPQIRRAVIEVARIIPQLEEGEASLRTVCDVMNESWDEISADGSVNKSDFYIPDTDEKLERLLGETLSWMDRITKLKVGREGTVAVLSKDTMTILAHADQSVIGERLRPMIGISNDNILDLKTITDQTKESDIKTDFTIVELSGLSDKKGWTAEDVDSYMGHSMYGCIMEYEDYYIICGISFYEMLSFLASAFLVTLVLYLLIWLLIKWICLVFDGRCETTASLRSKLIASSCVILVITFVMSLYMQTLMNLTNELKAMTHHAEDAVDTLELYENENGFLGKWLDSFYEVRCRVAAKMIKDHGKENLTRNDLQKYSEDLGVKYIYVFDEKGNVIVTNSNYDHISVGKTEGEPLYDFRVLLEGVDHVVTPCAHDERYGEYIQYIGVSTRNDQDLCDGFVLIGVDPELRDKLTGELSLDTVLNYLVVGLPEYALAVNKNTLTISGTTGLGYKGENIEELGISKENLEQNFSGFLDINDVEYIVGVSSSSDDYLVPIMKREKSGGAIYNAAALTFWAAIILIILAFVTLFGYKNDIPESVIDNDDSDPDDEDDEDKDEEDNLKTKSRKLLSKLIHARNKADLDERWSRNIDPDLEKTPRMHIKKIIYRLMLLFCVLVLIPTLYTSFFSSTRLGELSRLSYVISGKWEKGVNIFAFTSCLLLLCGMYVVTVLIDMLLYQIARASDMRVETVCLLLRNALKYIMVIVFIYYGLSQFGVDTKTQLASVGILSLMVSLGAKDMVSDILAGFFIIFDGTYKVGDWVRIGSWEGEVTQIGLRTTRIKCAADIKIMNNSSMRDVVNLDPDSCVSLKIPISVDSDITEVEKIMKEELPLIGPGAIPGSTRPPRFVGITSIEEGKIFVQIIVFADIRKKYNAMIALNREVKIILDKRGIKIPCEPLLMIPEK